MSIILFALFGAIATSNDIQGAPRPKTLSACAAFAPDGISVAATIEATNASVEFTDATGKISRLSLPLRYPSIPAQIEHSAWWQLYSCQIHFDQSGDLAAIGITSGITLQQLQVAVIDTKALKWIADWTVERDAQILAPVMAGFLEGTRSLVIVGESPANNGNGRHWGLLNTALYDLDGKQIIPTHTLRYAEDGRIYPKFADAAHNRLWIIPCEVVSATMSHQPLCPVAVMNLTGDQSASLEMTPSVQGNRTDLWLSPGAFAALDPDVIVFGEEVRVWRVNVREQTIKRLELPDRPHFPHLDHIEGPAAISADSQILAMRIIRSRFAFPFMTEKTVYQGADIAVIRQDPFELLGILPHRRNDYTPAIAVDHRQGGTTVLVYRKDHWERHEMNGFVHK
jgi:hypothetical protein